MFTSHGHQIPGTTVDVLPATVKVARCGGVGLCVICAGDALQAKSVPPVTETFMEKAERIVFDHIKDTLEKTDTHVTFSRDEVYIVWWSKVLQNWKALVSTTLPDGMYYEVTYNGDKHETYLDCYKKFQNVRFPD